jgi:hypothetical protein
MTVIRHNCRSLIFEPRGGTFHIAIDHHGRSTFDLTQEEAHRLSDSLADFLFLEAGRPTLNSLPSDNDSNNLPSDIELNVEYCKSFRISCELLSSNEPCIVHLVSDGPDGPSTEDRFALWGVPRELW